MPQKRLAVFISGFGSNLNIFLENKEKFKDLLVISSNPKAYGLKRAQDYGVEAHCPEQPIDWDQLNQFLRSKQINFIFLAGFMKILPAEFIQLWPQKIHNLHPSLLPDFKGLKAIERAYQAQKSVGVSIHQVVEEVDGGLVLLQQVAVDETQIKSLSLEQVTEKTHQTEHALVREWIKRFPNFDLSPSDL